MARPIIAVRNAIKRYKTTDANTTQNVVIDAIDLELFYNEYVTMQQTLRTINDLSKRT